MTAAPNQWMWSNTWTCALTEVRHRAYVEGRELDLTPTEFRLLECLLRQPGRAFSRHQLMDAAIGEGAIVLDAPLTCISRRCARS